MRSDGVEEIVGIVSYGRTAACDPPSYAVRVDAYADWIADVVAGHPATDCAKCPAEPVDCPPAVPDAGGDAPVEASADAGDVQDAGDADSPSAPPSGGGGGCSLSSARFRGSAGGESRVLDLFACALVFACAVGRWARSARNQRQIDG
jgi:hypothetical protein